MMKHATLKMTVLRTAAVALATMGMAMSHAQTVVFDDFEHGDPVFVGWFAFGSDIGGGGIDPNGADLAPIPGNMVGMQTGWGSGAGPGFWGGFGWQNTTDFTGTDTFTMWINPDAGTEFTLEINIQEDENGDGFITPAEDEEWQYSCVIGPAGPCAISGGGWQKVEMPLADFVDDFTFLFGGDDVLNGVLHTMVAAVVGATNDAVTFRTDQWQFENSSFVDSDGDGVGDDVDNCTNVANGSQLDANGDGFGNACDADFDDNCIINFLDISTFAPEFNGTNPVYDIDGSGAVNFLDYIQVTGAFGGQPGPSALASCN